MTDETTQLLERHFDTAFDAPDGIRKLRELILTLAMRGKLVEQDSSDPPANELLKAIALKKQELIEKGEIKKPRHFADITPEEIPYEIPKSWNWVRLGQVGFFERGKSKHRPRNDKCLFIDGIYPFVQTGDVSKAKHTNNQITTCSDYYNEFGLQQSRLWPKGSLCVTIAANIAETGFLAMEACVPDSVIVFLALNEVLSKLVKVFIDVAKEDLENYAPSTAQKNINLGIINELVFPLPPLPEQRRIVAKIDQLMARCDELEKLRTERDQKRLTVHTAALNRLLTAQTSDSFTDAWRFIAQHFGELYSVKENVAELRKAILQLAVMGKLVEQDPNDEPASELLKEIEAEKQVLVEKGQITKLKSFPEIKFEEMPYLLHSSWKWVRLGDVSIESSAGRSPQCLQRPRNENEWGVLKVSAVSWGEFRPNENKALPPEKEFRPEDEVKVGDFLLSRANTEELVARSIVVKITPPRLLISDKTVRFTLSENVNKQFINLVNLSKKSREYYAANASGTSSSMKNVTRDVMCKLCSDPQN